MTITIEVTAEDIRQGLKHNCQVCPVALALAREFPGATVDVFNRQVVVSANDGEGNYLVISLTRKAQDFIVRFDNGKSVKPNRFTFTDIRQV